MSRAAQTDRLLRRARSATSDATRKVPSPSISGTFCRRAGCALGDGADCAPRPHQRHFRRPPAALLLPRDCESDGVRASSCWDLTPANVVPMHRIHSVEPGRFCCSSEAGASSRSWEAPACWRKGQVATGALGVCAYSPPPPSGDRPPVSPRRRPEILAPEASKGLVGRCGERSRARGHPPDVRRAWW